MWCRHQAAHSVLFLSKEGTSIPYRVIDLKLSAHLTQVAIFDYDDIAYHKVVPPDSLRKAPVPVSMHGVPIVPLPPLRY